MLFGVMAVPGTCFRASIRASYESCVQTAIQIRVGHRAILQAVNCFKDLVPSSRYTQDSRGSKQLLKALASFQDGEWYALHAFLGVLELLQNILWPQGVAVSGSKHKCSFGSGFVRATDLCAAGVCSVPFCTGGGIGEVRQLLQEDRTRIQNRPMQMCVCFLSLGL